MKRYDIVVPKKYQKDGEEKTSWKNVGSLVQFPATEDKAEGFKLELNMFPETAFKVFEQKPKADAVAKNETTSAFPPEVNPDDIPF